MSTVSFSSTDPARLPSTTTSYVPRRTSTPMVLCVSLNVADIADLLLFRKAFSLGPRRRAATWRRQSSACPRYEPFAVEHRGHDALSEQVDGQQRSGETEREGGRPLDYIQRHQGDGLHPPKEQSRTPKSLHQTQGSSIPGPRPNLNSTFARRPQGCLRANRSYDGRTDEFQGGLRRSGSYSPGGFATRPDCQPKGSRCVGRPHPSCPQ